MAMCTYCRGRAFARTLNRHVTCDGCCGTGRKR